MQILHNLSLTREELNDLHHDLSEADQIRRHIGQIRSRFPFRDLYQVDLSGQIFS